MLIVNRAPEMGFELSNQHYGVDGSEAKEREKNSFALPYLSRQTPHSNPVSTLSLPIESDSSVPWNFLDLATGVLHPGLHGGGSV